MTRLRYSRPKFRVTIAVAAAMTAMIAGVTWMLLNAFGVAYADFYVGLSALAFFAFCSAAMLARYLTGGVVLAIQPNGLFDARWRSEPVPWERIREIVVRRRENEIELDVYLWRPQGVARGAEPAHTVELASLEGIAGEVIQALARHAVIRTERLNGDAPIEGLTRIG